MCVEDKQSSLWIFFCLSLEISTSTFDILIFSGLPTGSIRQWQILSHFKHQKLLFGFYNIN